MVEKDSHSDAETIGYLVGSIMIALREPHDRETLVRALRVAEERTSVKGVPEAISQARRRPALGEILVAQARQATSRAALRELRRVAASVVRAGYLSTAQGWDLTKAIEASEARLFRRRSRRTR